MKYFAGYTEDKGIFKHRVFRIFDTEDMIASGYSYGQVMKLAKSGDIVNLTPKMAKVLSKSDANIRFLDDHINKPDKEPDSYGKVLRVSIGDLFSNIKSGEYHTEYFDLCLSRSRLNILRDMYILFNNYFYHVELKESGVPDTMQLMYVNGIRVSLLMMRTTFVAYDEFTESIAITLNTGITDESCLFIRPDGSVERDSDYVAKKYSELCKTHMTSEEFHRYILNEKRRIMLE